MDLLRLNSAPTPSQAEYDSQRSAAERSLTALAASLLVGALAIISPPMALLALALLAARALIGGGVRFDLVAMAPPLAAAVVVGAAFGLAAGIGVVFAWRLFAEARWSIGEARRLAESAGRPAETSWRSLAHAWTTPVYALAIVAFTAPHMVAGLPLDLPHVPFAIPLAAGGVAAFAVFDWALKRAVDWRLGQLAEGPLAHLLAHHTLFLAAFGLTIDVSAGIVALITWRLMHAAPLRAPQASFTAVP